MLHLLTLLVTLANGLPRSHCDLLLENLALRQPLAALPQRHSRPRLVENCRRELFNHVIVLNERHLKCLMSEVGRPESSPAQKTVNSQISGPAPRVCLALGRRIPTAQVLIKSCDRALPNSLRAKGCAGQTLCSGLPQDGVSAKDYRKYSQLDNRDCRVVQSGPRRQMCCQISLEAAESRAGHPLFQRRILAILTTVGC